MSKVMKAFSSPSLRRLLVSCSRDSQSVSNLATKLEIPLSTAYNYVRELVEAGLLVTEQIIITDEGKRYEMYRSTATQVRTIIESDKMVVEILPNENTASRFYRLWSSLKKVK